MSYISNGCNDCSTVDFGVQAMGSMGQLSGNGGYGGYGGGMQQLTYPTVVPETTSSQVTSGANPYQYQQEQPVQQTQPIQQVPQMQQIQSGKPMIKMPPRPQGVGPVLARPVENQTGKSLQGTVSTYFSGSTFAIAIAFLVANAWHETIKYYINQAIKFNGGTPTYYIVYAVVATLASIFLSSLQ